jgi:hypothetical protein
MIAAHPGWPAFVNVFHIDAIKITVIASNTVEKTGCEWSI